MTGLNRFQKKEPGNFILRSRTNWYPNNVGSRFLDRAAFDLKFRYPKAYTLIGVGELIKSETDEGEMKFAHWSSKGVEMATAGFNYGDFAKARPERQGHRLPTLGLQQSSAAGPS